MRTMLKLKKPDEKQRELIGHSICEWTMPLLSNSSRSYKRICIRTARRRREMLAPRYVALSARRECSYSVRVVEPAIVCPPVKLSP